MPVMHYHSIITQHIRRSISVRGADTPMLGRLALSIGSSTTSGLDLRHQASHPKIWSRCGPARVAGSHSWYAAFTRARQAFFVSRLVAGSPV